MSKTAKAREIYQAMQNYSRGHVVSTIQSELNITKKNAQVYYSKLAKEATADGKATPSRKGISPKASVPPRPREPEIIEFGSFTKFTKEISDHLIKEIQQSLDAVADFHDLKIEIKRANILRHSFFQISLNISLKDEAELFVNDPSNFFRYLSRRGSFSF